MYPMSEKSFDNVQTRRSGWDWEKKGGGVFKTANQNKKRPFLVNNRLNMLLILPMVD